MQSTLAATRKFASASVLIRRKLSANVNNKLQRRFTNRNFSSQNSKPNATEKANMNSLYYMTTVVVFFFGLTYASVPLYKVFCSMTGFGGTTQVADEEKARKVAPVEGSKIIKVYFTSNVHSAMPWKFRPTQNEVKIIPGETALAFYTVKNTADHPITGVATYNVHPPKAGLYFNKIQCFCFEEQRLDAHEEIDMPVFFFIDPEFVDDPAMEAVNHITLSYTFFKTGEEEKRVVPSNAATTNSTNSNPTVAATTISSSSKTSTPPESAAPSSSA